MVRHATVEHLNLHTVPCVALSYNEEDKLKKRAGEEMYTFHINHIYTDSRDDAYIDIINHMRTEDRRSEHRIIRNRIRRQQEMKKHFLMFTITICLIIACSFTLSTFRSNAKMDSSVSYKYYKSIAVSNNDTLWSLAEQYMDRNHYDSIADYINEVKSMNSLTDDDIHYGEYLIIPYYDSNYIR